MTSIMIVDYGMANLRSVQKAFEKVGHEANITDDPNLIIGADKVVLPGVGAFRDAIARLRDAELHAQLRRLPLRDRTLLALRYGAGLDSGQVGQAVGLSSDSAGKALRRALARLRARLKETPK